MSEASDDLVIVDHGDGEDTDDGEYTTADSGGSPTATITSTTMDEGKETSKSSPTSLLSSSKPHAVQIVAIVGEEGHHRFEFRKELFDEILNDIPVDYRVTLVSVVGAFRTGKSFLLSWFVRYMYSNSNDNNGTPKIVAESKSKGAPAWYEQFSSIGNDGFEWKAGSERNTTGIWMWSEAFLDRDRRVATLLVDTQGMFDHETTMNLTASIFGFTTLVSSYLVYNVDKRIQEDHLQQLALFSEYARDAVRKDKPHGQDEHPKGDEGIESAAAAAVGAAVAAPFQHVEFLVRDWQHFDLGDDEDDLDKVNFDAVIQTMMDYLDTVMEDRPDKDLKETREQINTCFRHVTCYGLCHPGFEVTKKKYTGDVSVIEPLFLRLLDRYCHRVFETAQPKTIHGRTLTVAELGSYAQAYASLFEEGTTFPTAATLLAATSQANNTNALQLALSSYSLTMDRVSGPKCSSYLKPEELKQEHQRAVERSMEKFDSIATFGSQSKIDEARESLVNKVLEQYEVYASLNEGRNPLAGLETFILPVLVGLASYVIRWVTDLTCSATVCRATSTFFGHTSEVVFSFLAILGATKFQQIMSYVQRLRSAWDALSDPNANAAGNRPTKVKAS